MLDTDLAELYGVETKMLNRAVKRRSQIGTSKNMRGGRRYLPYVFTEQGVAMLSSVLNSKRAIQVNIAIMRAFVKLRETLLLHKELAKKLAELERKVEGHDHHIHSLFEAIRQLMSQPEPRRRHIGFGKN